MSVAKWLVMHISSKKLLTSVFAVGALASLTLACTKDTASGLDAADALSKFQHPTGTFSSDNSEAAFSGYKAKQDESSRVSMPDGTSSAGTSSTQSIHILTTATATSSACNAGSACACATSGSFTFESDKTANAATPTLNFHFDKCMNPDGSGFDGDAVLIVSDQPIVGIAKSGATAASSKVATQSVPGGSSSAQSGGDDDDDGFEQHLPAGSDTDGTASSQDASGSTTAAATSTKNFLITAKGTGFGEGQSLPLAFSLAQEAGYVLLSVDLSDGNIVVGVSKDGTAFVKSKQGTWNCVPSDTSGYSCTSADGAAPVKVSAAN